MSKKALYGIGAAAGAVLAGFCGFKLYEEVKEEKIEALIACEDDDEDDAEEK